MPFKHKDGRFHFLFLNREDDYISESLRVIDWKQWTWIRAYEAGYGRILFAEPSGTDQIRLEGFVRKDPDAGRADWQKAKKLLGTLLGKPDSLCRGMLSSLDTKGFLTGSHEDFRSLTAYILSQEEEGQTAFVIPVGLFAELDAERPFAGFLKEVSANGGAGDLTRSAGSVFVLCASLEAEESFPYLADRNGAFASELFPEMRSYVWSQTKPGSFYQRMQDVFTGKRMVCRDPLDRQSVYLLCVRGYLASGKPAPDPGLLKKEADSLYALLHGSRWGRELSELKASSPFRELPLPRSGEERPLHALLDLARRADLPGLLQWSVQVFRERYPDRKSISEEFGGDDLPDQTAGRRPGLKAGSVTEFEVFKKAASSYAGTLGPAERSRVERRLERVERYLYVPWESGNGAEGTGLVPGQILEVISKGTQWLNSFRDYGFGSCDSIFRFLESMIVKKPDERQRPDSQEDCARTEGTYAQLVGLELAAADAKRRLGRIAADGTELERRISLIVGQLEKLETENPLLLRETAGPEDDPMPDRERREFERLSGSLHELHHKLQENRHMQELIRSEYDDTMRSRDQVVLLLDAVGKETRSVQARKVDDLIRELKTKMNAAF